MSDAHRATVDFTLRWTSFCAEHSDVQRFQIIDFRHDIFPANVAEKLAALEEGESYTETFSAETLLDATFTAEKLKRFARSHFQQDFKGQAIQPKQYRFYPTAIAREGLNAANGDFRPFRIISIDDSEMTADTNHSLSKYYLTLSATIVKKLAPSSDEEARPRHIGKLVCSKGSGMQVPFEYGNTSLFDEYPMVRADDEDDEVFYSKPRLTHHIDAVARAEISNLYSELLDEKSDVLDFMSSLDSHFNKDLSFNSITGLGLNAEELSANTRLSNYVVHDLNDNQILPFEDNQFDAAVCTVSIEYLTYPLKIMTEISRVVKPGGKFIVTFSERWFPTKAITLWTQIHPFERIQLVLEYFRDSGQFEALNTYSKRGLPRLEGETMHENKVSDPVYAVWGTVMPEDGS